MIDDLKREAARRAMKMLDAAGAQYAVILDGETFGTLIVKEPSKKTSWVSYPRGVTRAYYHPLISGMVAGDVVEVPSNGFDLKTLASNISASCVHDWGKGSAISTMDREADCVRVLRMI